MWTSGDPVKPVFLEQVDGVLGRQPLEVFAKLERPRRAMPRPPRILDESVARNQTFY
jgi:hypothetical protein